MRALQIIESAYRCTVEEQDDPCVWLTRTLHGAGAEVGVVLRGSAVNYAVAGQDAGGLRLGSLPQSHPPRIDRDLQALRAGGVEVLVVQEDFEARGIDSGQLLPGAELIRRDDLPAVFARYDQIWHW